MTTDNGTNGNGKPGRGKARPIKIGRIQVIPRQAMPYTGGTSPYAPLYRELLLRLERTPGSEILVVPLLDTDEMGAQAIRRALTKMFERRPGAGQVKTVEALREDGLMCLYVCWRNEGRLVGTATGPAPQDQEEIDAQLRAE